VAALWQELLIDEEHFQAERQTRALIARQKRIDLAFNQQASESEAEQGGQGQGQGYDNKNNSRDNNKNKSNRGKKANNSLHYAELLPERFYTDLVNNCLFFIMLFAAFSPSATFA